MHLPPIHHTFHDTLTICTVGRAGVCVWYLVALDSVFLRAYLLLCSHVSYLCLPPNPPYPNPNPNPDPNLNP